MKKVLTAFLSLFLMKVLATNLSYDIPSSSHYEGDDIHITIPVYEFVDNPEGIFIKRFADSLSRNDCATFLLATMPSGVPLPEKNAGQSDFMMLTSLSSVFVFEDTTYQWSVPFNKIQGVFLLPDNDFGVLTDAPADWLSKMGLVRTDDTATINYGKSYRDPEILVYREVDGTVDGDLTAVLYADGSGKVDPVFIYHVDIPIQQLPSPRNHIMDWIEEFYEENDLPGGALFYSQPQRLTDRDYRSLHQTGTIKPKNDKSIPAPTPDARPARPKVREN